MCGAPRHPSQRPNTGRGQRWWGVFPALPLLPVHLHHLLCSVRAAKPQFRLSHSWSLRPRERLSSFIFHQTIIQVLAFCMPAHCTISAQHTVCCVVPVSCCTVSVSSFLVPLQVLLCVQTLFQTLFLSLLWWIKWNNQGKTGLFF